MRLAIVVSLGSKPRLGKTHAGSSDGSDDAPTPVPFHGQTSPPHVANAASAADGSALLAEDVAVPPLAGGHAWKSCLVPRSTHQRSQSLRCLAFVGCRQWRN